MRSANANAGVFDLFDGLILLHRGALCYFGAGRDEPCAFFGAQGFPYRAGWNVAEFLLETISTRSKPTSSAGVTLNALAVDAETGAAAAPPHDFTAYYAQSELCARQKKAVDEETQCADAPGGIVVAKRCEQRACSAFVAQRAADALLLLSLSGSAVHDLYVNPMWREVLVLLRFRGATRYVSPLFIFSRITLFAMLAALFATFFYNQARSDSLMQQNVILLCLLRHDGGRSC